MPKDYGFKELAEVFEERTKNSAAAVELVKAALGLGEQHPDVDKLRYQHEAEFAKMKARHELAEERLRERQRREMYKLHLRLYPDNGPSSDS